MKAGGKNGRFFQCSVDAGAMKKDGSGEFESIISQARTSSTVIVLFHVSIDVFNQCSLCMMVILETILFSIFGPNLKTNGFFALLIPD